MDILRQTACIVVNPMIMVNDFASLFNCTTVGRSLDKITAPSSICIAKTCLFKYTENFTTKNWIYFR